MAQNGARERFGGVRNCLRKVLGKMKDGGAQPGQLPGQNATAQESNTENYYPSLAHTADPVFAPDYSVIRQHVTHSCKHCKDVVLAIKSKNVQLANAASETLLMEAVHIARSTDCLFFKAVFDPSFLLGFSLTSNFSVGQGRFKFVLPSVDAARQENSQKDPPLMWFEFQTPPYGYEARGVVPQGKLYDLFMSEQGNSLFFFPPSVQFVKRNPD